MKELTIFKNEKFGEIRTIEIDGNVWFVGKDIASALGYEKPSVAISKKVDEYDKQLLSNSECFQNGNLEVGNRGLMLINESGLYSLILSSKLESAKEFKHWVTSEVLPTLRKTGSYSVQPMTMEDCMKIIAQSSAQISSAISALSVQTQTNTAQLQDNTSRIEKLEKKFEEHKLDIPPEMPVKDYVISVVRDISNKTKTPFQDIYRKLYSDYGLITHTNPSVKAKNRNMTTIVFIEKEGDINLLAQLAHKLLQDSNEDKEKK